MSSPDRPAAPWRLVAEGLALSLRLTPRGGRDALEGVAVLSDGSRVLKARVRAAATEGEANAALLQLLAREFRLPRSEVVLAAGATSRIKSVLLRGDGPSHAAALERRFGALPPDDAP